MNNHNGKPNRPSKLLRLRTFILSLFVLLVAITGGGIGVFSFWVESNEAITKGDRILSLLAIDTCDSVESLVDNIKTLGDSLGHIADKQFPHFPSEDRLSQAGYGFVSTQPSINAIEFIDELSGTSVLVVNKHGQSVTQVSKRNPDSGIFESVSYSGNMKIGRPSPAVPVSDPRKGKRYQMARETMFHGWSDTREMNDGAAGGIYHVFSYIFMLSHADGSPMGLLAIDISLTSLRDMLVRQQEKIGYDGCVFIAERNKYGRISVLGSTGSGSIPLANESLLLFSPEDHPDNRIRAFGQVLSTATQDQEDLFNMNEIKPVTIRSDDGYVWKCALKSALVGENPDCLIVTMAREDLLLAKVHLHRKIQLSIVLSILLVGSAVGWWLSNLMAKPLELLAVDIADICQGAIHPSPDFKSNMREIAELGRGIEILKAGLITLRRYSPHELVDQIVRTRREAELFVERRELTLFFSDIEGFTTFSETLLPNQLLALTSDFLASFTRAIQQRRGNVDKFIGDSVMAFWNAPLPEKDHALLACLAALDCQQAISQINSRSVASGLPAIRARIGIHTGSALVGNIGSEDRMNYTAMGDTVNLASRLEGANKQYGTGIMISEMTRFAAGSGIQTRPVDCIAVKGKSIAVPVHELVGETGRLSELELRKIDLTRQGWELYLARKFHESRVCYASIIEETGEDTLAKVFIDRCTILEAHPPENDWTGEMYLDSK